MALRRQAHAITGIITRQLKQDASQAIQVYPSISHLLWLHTDSSRKQDRHHLLAFPPSHLHGLCALQSAQHIALVRLFGTKADGKAEKPYLISDLPDAKDCDEVLSNYDKLRTKYERLSYPPTYKPWQKRISEYAVVGKNVTVSVLTFLVRVPGYLYHAVTMPAAERNAKLKGAWQTVKHEAHHYWVGAKLLGYEVKVAASLASKSLAGTTLSRRERKQLTRTVADLIRLVPMIVILVIPFLEFALPLILRIFPNMLPSTFEDKLKKEEELKRRLVVKLELARFLQDTVAEMAKDLTKQSSGPASATAASLVQFISKVRAGEVVENHELLNFAQLFKDELTLDKLERVHLVSICQFVGITPFGTDQFLRSRLRAHLTKLKEDDKEIKAEGVDALTEDELRQACRERGLRAPYGEGAVPYMRRQLNDWLELSLQRGLPSSLLLLSRAFTITTSIRDVQAKRQAQMESLKDTLSTLPEEVIEEVQMDAFDTTGSGAVGLQKKLDLLKRESALIAEEEAERKRTEQATAAAAPVSPAASAEALQSVRQDVAAVAAAAVMKEAAAGAATESLMVDGLSEEEKAVRVAAQKEARMRDIVNALTVLASSSGVAKEREMFVDLVKNEINRVNQVFAQRGSAQLLFSGGNLQSSRPDEVPVELEGASKALSLRVDGIIHRLEAELDAVDAQIGEKLHLLDEDNDGMISREELENAIRFMREQLGGEELKHLLERLNAASPDARIPVAELQALSDSVATKSDDPTEVVKIHTK